jgi:hypothetical protein
LCGRGRLARALSLVMYSGRPQIKRIDAYRFSARLVGCSCHSSCQSHGSSRLLRSHHKNSHDHGQSPQPRNDVVLQGCAPALRDAGSRIYELGGARRNLAVRSGKENPPQRKVEDLQFVSRRSDAASRDGASSPRNPAKRGRGHRYHRFSRFGRTTAGRQLPGSPHQDHDHG